VFGCVWISTACLRGHIGASAAAEVTVARSAASWRQPVENVGLGAGLAFSDFLFPRLASFLLLIRLQPSS